MNSMKNKILWQSIALSFATLLVIYLFALAPFQNAKAQDAVSSQNDAIGIRVIPNPNHYSVSRWYESQGFSGSPQALTVDGYEALRDGRTVYINAAHVVPQDKTIYTNIYLISYNQDQSHLTTDILGQIISHWEFNDNLADEEATCSISALKCSSNVDCPDSQVCSPASGTCQLEKSKNCQVDDDCPTNFFCSSLKSKIIRDLNRVGKIEELREGLAKYREANGRYPQLSSGTYLPGASTSLWPSWQESFLPMISMKKNFLDPINRLGPCDGYDNKTCWNKDRQSFIFPKENISLKLPNDSYALVYTTNDSGSEYNLCAVMESRDKNDPNLGYSLSPNDPQGSDCVLATGIISGGNASNRPPQITATALGGSSGLEYNGFVKASDPDNDPLTWTLSSSADFSSWSEKPYIKATSDSSQKKIYAARAGRPGTYPITITVRDDKGLSVSENGSIVIKEAGTLAEASEYIYRLDPVNQFNYSFYVSGANSSPNYSLSLVSGKDVLSFAGITKSETADGINRLKVNYKGTFNTNIAFTEDSESVYSLSTDGNEASRFIIKIKVDRPVLDFNCDSQIRIGHEYSCFLGSSAQANHTVSYSASGLPAGIELIISEEEDGSSRFHLEGLSTQEIKKQEIKVSARNEYQTENSKTFNLSVNTYCGDGILQSPNSEGRGGMYNNGYEACDGNGNVATSAKDSSKTRQYACNTPGGSITPYPIPSYDYCIFKSPLDGGGYCGDSYCQVGMEDKTNCAFDCDPRYNINDEVLGGDAEPEGCVNNSECPDGYTCVTGVCVIKKFRKEELVSKVYFNSGDAVNSYRTYYMEDGRRYEVSASKLGYNSAQAKALNFLQGYDDTWDANVSSYSCSSCKWDDLVAGKSPKNCCTVYIDNPYCANVTECPPGYTNLTRTSNKSLESDSCYKKRNFWQSNWLDRHRYSCIRRQNVERYFGDPCRSSISSTAIDGTINANGACVKNATPPSGGGGGGGGGSILPNEPGSGGGGRGNEEDRIRAVN